ncbi:hypothetical protein KR044_002967, partial [Drosophila immigrans]
IMAEIYSSEVLRIVIAQIAQTIGYCNTQNAPLELLEDILLKFVQELARDLHSQVEHANRSEPNIRDVQLSFSNLSIDVHELIDYIGNVEPVPFAREVPEYPVKRNSHLNFLKPGSAETLTRPVHIFEYLPAMLPPTERILAPSSSEIDNLSPNYQKKCADNSLSSSGGREQSATDLQNWCKQIESSMSLKPLSSRDHIDTIDGHAVRTINSVVMTTGGFISPAIEGKLPEAFIPQIIEKLKGLDAPPSFSSNAMLETKNSITVESNLLNARNQTSNDDAVNEPNSQTGEKCLLNEISSVNNNKSENKTLEEGVIMPALTLPIQGLSKPIKSKKKYLIGEELDVNKSQEKARRKAFKMYHKFSKGQVEGDASMVGFKKSTKHLNRGGVHSILTTDSRTTPTERTQHEKLLKKQTKRQKQLKSQKQELQQQGQQQLNLQMISKQLSGAEVFSNAILNQPKAIAASLPAQSIPLPSVDPSAVKNTFDSPTRGVLSLDAAQVNQMDASNDLGGDDVKLGSEPDRNKLNIFKKLSKPKTIKSLAPNALHTMPTNLFGNASNGSPLVNLPSGTTITPAPALSVTDIYMTASNLIMPVYKEQSIATEPILSEHLTDLNIPKKRGRKPGGKNSSAKTHVSNELMTSKKIKPGKLNAAPAISYPPVNLSMTTALMSIGTESINSSHIVQAKQTKQLPNKFSFIDKKNTKTLSLGKESIELNQISLSKSPTNPNGIKHFPANLSSPIGGVHGYIASMGTLPILSFPPRPGLIPTGLFPPTSLANFGKNKIMSHSFMSLPDTTSRASSVIGYGSSLLETNSATDTSMLQLADSHSERSYCNVAPLVPESMKIATLPVDGHKPNSMIDPIVEESMEIMGTDIMSLSKNSHFNQGVGIRSKGIEDAILIQKMDKLKTTTVGTGNLGDPIEVSDDSNDNNVSNNGQKGGKSKSDGFLQNPNIRTSIQKFDSSSNPYSIMANPISSFKKLPAFKMNQHESMNPLSVVPSSSSSAFNINFIGNDKFSLAGGADLIPLSCVDSGLAYSSRTVPATSLAAGATSEVTLQTLAQPSENNFVPNLVGSSSFDDITITPTNNPSNSLNDLKLHKLHKKPKRTKEGKSKKKKDKKDKTKNKDKCDEKSSSKIDKLKYVDRKQKKDKKKDKLDNLDGIPVHIKDITLNSGLSLGSGQVAVSGTILQAPAQEVATPTYQLPSPKLDMSPHQVPKLTLKLGGKSTPIPISPNQSDGGEHDSQIPTVTSHNIALTSIPTKPTKREHSPELARFSPLVTGPPKPKQYETQSVVSTTTPVPVSASSDFMLANTNLIPNGSVQNNWLITAADATASPNFSATLSASSVLLPQQLLQVIPKRSSFPPLSQKVVLSPSTHTEEELSVSSQNADSKRPSSYVDAEGYRIWICPACGKVDDGSAMIGCDGCDAWYHWTCVGIFVAPNDNEDWFCRVCITKKKVHGSEKKKRRNKKK